MPQSFKFTDPFHPLLEKLAVRFALLAVVACVYLYTPELLGMFNTEQENAVAIMKQVCLIGIAVIIFNIISTSLTKVTVGLSLENAGIKLELKSFLDSEAKEKSLKTSDIYRLKQTSDSKHKILFTRFGKQDIYSADGLKEFSSVLNSKFLLNPEHYKQLDNSALFDIYQKLPGGTQTQMVRNEINFRSDETKDSKLNELLVATPTLPEEWESFTEKAEPQNKNAKIKEEPTSSPNSCLNCSENTLVPGSIIDPTEDLDLEFKANIYSLPFLDSLAGGYPEVMGKAYACINCGTLFGQIDKEKLALDLKKYTRK